jgi:HEXXH motif-containing protein
MKLDETRWIMGGGVDAEWRWVHRRRLDETRAGLRAALARLTREAPVSVRNSRLPESARFLLRAKGPRADRALGHPCLDYWLSLWSSHFSRPCEADDWSLQWGLLGGLAAALALEEGSRLDAEATLDPDGSLYLHGLPWALDFPDAGRRRVRLAVDGGVLRVKGPGVAAVFSLADAAPGGSTRRLDEAVPGIVVDDRGWLQVHGVTMHGLLRLDDAARRSFAETIGRAVRDMAERDPRLHAEMTDLLRALVPLANPMNHGSVSSSYVNLRGMIALSPSDDPLLQAETLIHEFCHMKLNQLLAADPLFMPGQNGQVFYSPWRPDARRLRGLLIGAHAFLNVGRYLARSLERESYDDVRRLEIMSNVARRLYQVQDALTASVEHGSFTEFGRRFAIGMWRELGLLRHAVQWFPPALLAEQRAEHEAHRREHALPGTWLHKTAALVDAVPRARFSPSGARAAEAPSAASAPPVGGNA